MDLKDRKFSLSTKLAPAFLQDLSFGLKIVPADCLKIEIHWYWGHVYLDKGWLIKSFPLTGQGYGQWEGAGPENSTKRTENVCDRVKGQRKTRGRKKIFYQNVSLTFDPISAGIGYRYIKHKLNLKQDVQEGVTIISPPLLSIKYELWLGKSHEWLTLLLSLLPLHFPAVAINLLAFKNWLGWLDLISTWFSSDPTNTQESSSHSMPCLLFL